MLNTLLAARRRRYSTRNVTCTTSRYHARDDGRPALSTKIVAINLTGHTPPPHPTPTASTEVPHPFRHRPPAASTPSTPPVPTRRQLVTAILLSQPGRDWHGFELATKLHLKPHNLLTQLPERARLGFIRRTGAATYTLDGPPPNCPPDHLATRFPGIAATPDSDKKRGTVQRPQRSQDEQPCVTTSAVHNGLAPGSDTPTASWT